MLKYLVKKEKNHNVTRATDTFEDTKVVFFKEFVGFGNLVSSHPLTGGGYSSDYFQLNISKFDYFKPTNK